jgi:predicted ATPase
VAATTDWQAFEAIALFVARARAVRPDLLVTPETLASIADLCARLDGLPLAIELAAARCKLFTPAALLNQLARRLDFFATANRGIAERQRTLRRTIDWSFTLLREAEKRLFAHKVSCWKVCLTWPTRAWCNGWSRLLMKICRAFACC